MYLSTNIIDVYICIKSHTNLAYYLGTSYILKIFTGILTLGFLMLLFMMSGPGQSGGGGEEERERG
jgi:hypothetical protein